MASRPSDSLSVKLTTFSLKCCGFWNTNSKFGERVFAVLLLYTISSTSAAVIVTSIDVYKSYDDFDRFTYSSMNIFAVGIGLCKVIYFIFKRRQLLDLISYVKKHFWDIDYDDYGTGVMEKCMSKCTGIVIFAIFMCNLTVSIHLIRPLIVNRGKNESDREFPFRFHSDLPITLSPWYEILYVITLMTTYPCTYAYYCFDNFLCQMNITIVGQFMILEKNMREVCDNQDEKSSSNECNIYQRFVRCVQKHQQLIACVENIKELYSGLILAAVVIFSFLISLEMYQLMTSTANSNPIYTFHYCIYAGGSITQLYFYTMTCDDLTTASVALADAAYDVQGLLLESGASRNQLIEDLAMVMMRSQKPCSLTVGGFAPVTLRTFTSICNTAFSFLTLMRQSSEKNNP